MSLSAAARSAAALVKDKLTPNCHFVVSAESEKVNCSIYWKELANDIDAYCELRLKFNIWILINFVVIVILTFM